MGKLVCQKCKQTADGDTFEEADEKINHAASSIRCAGDPAYMLWYESTPKITTDTATTSSKKSSGKKSSRK